MANFESHGKNHTRKKFELQSVITNTFCKPESGHTFMKLKRKIEQTLNPWVIAEPKEFPKLKAIPFVFANTLP
ncbi:hypothetical protein Ptr902_05309 [Pyrenophora tritici-repentis]|nr:hypothetical protein Ptr902_05309 [Pyrenophora tritici-repentis]